VLGGGEKPLVVSGGTENPLARAALGVSLNEIGTELLAGIVADLLRPKEVPPAPELPPPADQPPQGASLDTEENQ